MEEYLSLMILLKELLQKIVIENYRKLGFKTNPLNLVKLSINNEDSGYFCAVSAGNKLIFDASPLGPDYIPAHAHADSIF